MLACRRRLEQMKGADCHIPGTILKALSSQKTRYMPLALALSSQKTRLAMPFRR